MPLIDFAEVRRLVPILQLLDWLDWKPVSRHVGQRYRGPCPVHGGRSRHSRSLAVEAKAGKWYCHKCRCGGDVIDLYARVMATDLPSAARELCLQFGHDVPTIRGTGRGTVPTSRAGRNGSPS
jgi:DNA primase